MTTGMSFSKKVTNSRDMVERKYQITTDMTDTVGAVFLAQTVGCARCHNHKFDPIPQTDYYRFLAVFDNTVKKELPLLPLSVDANA